jgi:hypothetical protein
MSRVSTGGLARLDMYEFMQRYNGLVMSSCPDTLRVLSRVHQGGCVSVGTVLRKWTSEEAVVRNSRVSSTQLRVATYVEVVWPEGHCPRCPIEVLVAV